MVNGANFFDANGQAGKLSIDEKKKRIESFAKTFMG